VVVVGASVTVTVVDVTGASVVVVVDGRAVVDVNGGRVVVDVDDVVGGTVVVVVDVVGACVVVVDTAVVVVGARDVVVAVVELVVGAGDVVVEPRDVVVVVEGVVDDVGPVDDVDVVVVTVVVVVVVGHATPQHGRVGSWTTVAAGVITAVPRIVGGDVRQTRSFAAVAVSAPAIVMPVEAFRMLVAAAGAAPGPVQMSCPVLATFSWQVSISMVPATAIGSFTGSIVAVVWIFPLTVVVPLAWTWRLLPNSSLVMSISLARTMSPPLAK
jgi:hypothetical protein